MPEREPGEELALTLEEYRALPANVHARRARWDKIKDKPPVVNGRRQRVGSGEGGSGSFGVSSPFTANFDRFMLYSPPIPYDPALKALCFECTENPKHEASDAGERCTSCDHKVARRKRLAASAVGVPGQ